MQSEPKSYRFIGTVLGDGHLSVPDEVSREKGREFEVVMTPVDDTKKLISLYLDGRLEKSGSQEDIVLDASAIEAAVEQTFGTTDIDAILDIVRK
jgi:hypothetical protein